MRPTSAASTCAQHTAIECARASSEPAYNPRNYWERRNQQFLRVALDYFERAIAADPDYALAHAGVADCHTVAASGPCAGPQARCSRIGGARQFSRRSGHIDEAIKPVEDALRLSARPGFLVASLAGGYALVGRTDGAKTLLDELLRRRQSEYIAPIQIADVHVALGDFPRACDFMEQALHDRNAALAWVPSTPFYDVIRDEPRFAAVMAQIRS
jgi:tetratricopeptide (TPR) repeat protein